jgi:hypothetical protein
MGPIGRMGQGAISPFPAMTAMSAIPAFLLLRRMRPRLAILGASGTW